MQSIFTAGNYRKRESAFHSIIFCFMIVMLITGLYIVKDYGISWDEKTSREQNGLLSFNYIFHGNETAFRNSYEKYHGSIFEVFLIAVEKILNLNSSRSVYLMRHTVTFLIFWTSGWFFIAVIKRIFKNNLIALAGIIMYFISPRIFADAFYNNKDIPFLAVYTIAIYSGIKLINFQSYRNIVIHGFICGILISLRITGIVIPSIMFFILLYMFIRQKNLLKEKFFKIVTYLGITFFSTILLWPVLWLHPLSQFHIAFGEMAHFNWPGNNLYLGNFIDANKIPWHYSLVWIFLTIPVFYCLLFISGLLMMMKAVVTSFKRNILQNLQLTFILLAFIAPVIAVIILHSVLYDGWRHLYFIYPAFLLIACFALKLFIDRSIFNSRMTLILFTFLIIPVAIKMFRLHPYEHLYFNGIYYKDLSSARFNMEMDYWGLTYREALEYIAMHDNRKSITVRVGNTAGIYNLLMLPENQVRRLKVTTANINADYFAGNYRWQREEYNFKNPVFSVIRENTAVLKVFRLK